MIDRKSFIGSVFATVGALKASAAEEVSFGGVRLDAPLPVEDEVDVLVVGGGPAGLTAAIAASRAGKRVFLAETSGAFGGAATAAGVPTFCMFGDGERLLVGGIGMELRRMVSKAYSPETAWVPLNSEKMKLACDRLIANSSVKFSLFTTLCAARTEGRRLDAAVFASKRGLFAVRAKVFVDATGDADLVAFAGGSYEKGDANGGVMPATLCTLWGGIDFARRSSFKEQTAQLEVALGDGHFSVPDRHLTGITPTPDAPTGTGGGNVGHVFGVDPTDERSLTKAMIDARRRMPEFESFFRKYLKGYDNLGLLATAPYLGVRESRRVRCDYMLTEGDFKARASFADEIGRYCYPVDIHPSSADPKAMSEFQRKFREEYSYGKGESYGIPYRSLVASSFDNVLVAGRCIGTDRAMQASVRVIPGCFITGQAAGAAAALAVDADAKARKVEYAALRARLKSLGAVLREA